MLLFLTATLILSSLAMVLLLCAKRWEITTGKVLFSGIRPQITAVSSRMLIAVGYHVPDMFTRARRHAAFWLRTRARDIFARALIAAEHFLESLLETLKHGLSPARGATGQASAFLREVAEHKRKLTRMARSRRMAQKEISSEEPPRTLL